MIGALPDALTISGKNYKIRTDYRNILHVFEVFSDTELDEFSKWVVVLYLLFYDFNSIEQVEDAIENGFDFKEAVKQVQWFLTAGAEEKADNEHQEINKPLFDWMQDEQIIFSAINKVAGKEVRAEEYMHWWTFYGYFNEIGEGTFQTVVGIRNKLNKHKELEQYEKDFYKTKKDLIVLKKKLSAEEQAAEDQYQSLLNEVL